MQINKHLLLGKFQTKSANYQHRTASAYVGLCLCLCQSVNQPLVFLGPDELFRSLLIAPLIVPSALPGQSCEQRFLRWRSKKPLLARARAHCPAKSNRAAIVKGILEEWRDRHKNNYPWKLIYTYRHTYKPHIRRWEANPRSGGDSHFKRTLTLVEGTKSLKQRQWLIFGSIP